MTALNPHAQFPSLGAKPPTAPAARVDIVDGVHRGVALSLDRERYMIGRAESADLVLHDAGVAERHVRLRLEGQQIALEAVGGELTVYHPDGSCLELAKGYGHVARLPLTLAVGKARLSLRHTAPTGSKPIWRKPHAALAAVLLLACGAVFAFHQQPEDDLSLTLPPTAAAVRTVPSVAQAKAWLGHQLEQAGLVGIRAGDDGQRLSASGTYPEEKKGAWQQLQREFDTRYGKHLVLEGSVREATAPQPPRVRFQAVWFGKAPYVIDGSGRQLFPGAPLEDHWILQAVEDGKVVLARGDERYTFTL